MHAWVCYEGANWALHAGGCRLAGPQRAQQNTRCSCWAAGGSQGTAAAEKSVAARTRGDPHVALRLGRELGHLLQTSRLGAGAGGGAGGRPRAVKAGIRGAWEAWCRGCGHGCAPCTASQPAPGKTADSHCCPTAKTLRHHGSVLQQSWGPPHGSRAPKLAGQERAPTLFLPAPVTRLARSVQLPSNVEESLADLIDAFRVDDKTAWERLSRFWLASPRTREPVVVGHMHGSSTTDMMPRGSATKPRLGGPAATGGGGGWVVGGGGWAPQVHCPAPQPATCLESFSPSMAAMASADADTMAAELDTPAPAARAQRRRRRQSTAAGGSAGGAAGRGRARSPPW